MKAFESLHVDRGQFALHWFEQSAFALKDSTGHVVWVDPYFPHDRPSEKFIHPKPPAVEAEWRVDTVLLTHDHRDHTNDETLARLHAASPNVRYVGPVESVERLWSIGIPQDQTTTIAAGDTVSIGNITVHAVYAKLPGGVPQFGIDPPDVTHLGFVIEIEGQRVYISGDPVNCFAEVDELVNPIAKLNPHIGILTTHPTEGEFPFFAGSAKTARRIGVKTAIPAHYDCFVKRNYDPQEWAAHFEGSGIRTLIIPRQSAVVLP